jgi:SPP1 gp7 family putative phage head morphogenesis protein
MRDIQTVIEEFLAGEGLQIWQQESATPRDRARRINETITQLASRELQANLVQWLEDRHLTTMARAARASFQRMQQTLPGSVDEGDLIGSPNITHQDRALNAELKNIDAGLLYNDSDSLAEEIGDRATRQIRIGFAQEEPVVATGDGSSISQRVEEVLLDGDAATRDEHGISGMTAKSKAELIAHDSVQDAYVTATHRRYLNNGFRYATYDAVIDAKTSTVCRRLNEVTVDMVEDPWLVPPNHPWCRSDLRPLLQLPEGEEPITRDEIGDQHQKRIWGTNGFRPKVIDTDQEFNPTVLNERLDRTGVGA